MGSTPRKSSGMSNFQIITTLETSDTSAPQPNCAAHGDKGEGKGGEYPSFHANAVVVDERDGEAVGAHLHHGVGSVTGLKELVLTSAEF